MKASPAVAEALIEAFGGRHNIIEVGACMTRLRLSLVDRNLADQQMLHDLGAAKVIEQGEQLHAVFGLSSDDHRQQILALLGPKTPQNNGIEEEEKLPEAQPESQSSSQQLHAALAPIGGIENIYSFQHVALTRLRLILKQAPSSATEIEAESLLVLQKISPQIYHLIAGSQASALTHQLAIELNKPPLPNV